MNLGGRKTKISIGIGISALAVSGWLYHRTSTAPPVQDANSENHANPAELAQMRDEIARLRREQQDIRTFAQTMAAQASAPREGSARPELAKGPAATEEASTKDPASSAKPGPTVEEARDQLEHRFALESRDSSWSDSATSRISSFLNPGLPPNSRLLSLECRKSMCRAEITHESVEDHQKFLRESLLSPANTWDGPLMATLGDNSGRGGVVTLAFLARPGVSLSPTSEVSE